MMDQRFGIPQATGAMLWCYSDYDPGTFEHPPLDEAIHERSFGLWRADGRRSQQSRW